MTITGKSGPKIAKEKDVDTLDVVRDIVQLALDQKVSRLKVGDIEIEMHPDAFKSPYVSPKPLNAMEKKLELEKRAREEEDVLYGSV